MKNANLDHRPFVKADHFYFILKYVSLTFYNRIANLLKIFTSKPCLLKPKQCRWRFYSVSSLSDFGDEYLLGLRS